MLTLILAWVLILAGATAVAAAAWGAFRVRRHNEPTPLRIWALILVFGISGLGLVGIGQGLRALIGILAVLRDMSA